MRYLKNKVYKAIQSTQVHNEILVKKEAPEASKAKGASNSNIVVKQESTPFTVKQEPTVVKCEPLPKTSSISTSGSPPVRKKEIQTNKNIVKNYARAMVNFALSEMANQYINKFAPMENIDLKEFKAFVLANKEDINSIKTLREMLMISDDQEHTKIGALKRIFKSVSEIFVKFYSVNWIFNSKLGDKRLHLRYRFKILRREGNPEHFTYLENFNKTR